MDRRVRLEGVYDIETARFMRTLSIDSYLFDFRPKSFNFLQGYKFLELMKEHYSPFDSYYLRFSSEKDFVVFKLLDDLKKCLQESGESLDNFYLEFSGNESREYYDQFEIPFFWHYDQQYDASSVLKAKNLRGLVLPFDLLESMHGSAGFVQLVAEIHGLLRNAPFAEGAVGGRGLILSLRWDANVFPSLYDYFHFDTISLPINYIIEKGYRKVRHEAIEKHLIPFL